VNADSDFQPTADALASAWGRNTRGLLVASPANPTGAVVPQLRLAELSAAIADRGGNLVVDEIYHGLTYGFEADTALALDNEVFVINSFSKYFGMTGWRLGWLVAPERHVREIEKLAQNLYIAPSTLAQHAALAAFHPATIAIFEHRRREFQARRDLMLPGLERLGFGVAAQPRGAFYVYADSSQLGPDSRILAERLLADAGVAATPGLDFGSNEPRRHMRFAYTVEQARIAEGLARMEKLLA